MRGITQSMAPLAEGAGGLELPEMEPGQSMRKTRSISALDANRYPR